MSGLTHFDERGASRMVDVSGKPETARLARASGLVRMEPATLALMGIGLPLIGMLRFLRRRRA